MPRRERYLKENVILLGVIPGPNEPKLHINTFLLPVVNELQKLWILNSSNNMKVLVRAALLCIGYNFTMNYLSTTTIKKRLPYSRKFLTF